MHPIDPTDSGSQQPPDVTPPAQRLTNKQIDYLLRSLRANTKAAKTAIMGLEPKLRVEFEAELNTFYPLHSDPVWEEAFRSVHEEWKRAQDKVEERCREHNIPRRFWPSIAEPVWSSGGLNMIKEYRAEMRRIAYLQIKAQVSETTEEYARRSANAELEILAHGFMTPFAKTFFDSLPKIDDLIKPLTAEQVFALMEGRAFPDDRGKLYSWNKPSLPEYQPDLLKGNEEDEED